MDKSKTNFGLDQVNNPTPEFANWIFRGYFIISKAAIGYICGISAAGALAIPVKTMLLYTLTVSLLLDPIMYGFSKLFGIVPDQVDPNKPFVASQQIDDKGNLNTIPDTVIDQSETT